MRKILLLSFILVMFLLLIACEQYVSNKSDDSLSDDSGLIPVAQIEETETEETETEEAISIVGTWHYEKSAHDCYIAFYSDGTGLIHYYQNYGSQTNLTGYVNRGIRRWSYSPETNSLGITIAGVTISGVNSDESFSYIVSSLTQKNLVIKQNGASNPVVPVNTELTRETSEYVSQ